MTKKQIDFDDTLFKILTDSEIWGKDISEAKDYLELSASEKEELLYSLDSSSDANTKKIKDKYDFSVVKQFGGEGQGDDYYYVVKLQDKYFYIPGWYNSDYGSELSWDDVYECEPFQETITNYRKVS